LEKIKKIWDSIHRFMTKTGLTYVYYWLGPYLIPQSKILCWLLDYFDRRGAMDKILQSKKFFEDNAARIKKNLALFSDDESRHVYENIILYRGSRDRKYVKAAMKSKYNAMYFDSDIITPQNGECFLDCGAFWGENSIAYQKFLKKHGCENPKVIAIEPDAKNFEHMVKNLRKKMKNEIHTFHCGVWSKEANLSFQSNINTSCKISKDGGIQIHVKTIDSIVEQTGLEVTYLKMDVEGSEMEALKGAEQTITRFRPKLALSIYHSDEHMLEIIEYIHEKYPAYKLYVRHYTGFFAETVLYCV